jgi:hypothetical protein
VSLTTREIAIYDLKKPVELSDEDICSIHLLASQYTEQELPSQLQKEVYFLFQSVWNCVIGIISQALDRVIPKGAKYKNSVAYIFTFLILLASFFMVLDIAKVFPQVFLLFIILLVVLSVMCWDKFAKREKDELQRKYNYKLAEDCKSNKILMNAQEIERIRRETSFLHEDILNLKDEIQGKEESKAKLRNLIQQQKIYISKEKFRLEEKILDFLKTDKDTILRRAEKQLDIKPYIENSESEFHLPIQDQKPFFIWRGVFRASENESRFTFTDRHINSFEKTLFRTQGNLSSSLNVDKSILIPEDRYGRKKTVSLQNSSKTIYGVYTFAILFWLESALIVYQGFWDFFSGVTVEETSSFYPYDNIVSIELAQRSSSNNVGIDKRVYQDTLSITMSDGKIFYIVDRDADKKFSDASAITPERNTQLSKAASRLQNLIIRYRSLRKKSV